MPATFAWVRYVRAHAPRCRDLSVRFRPLLPLHLFAALLATSVLASEVRADGPWEHINRQGDVTYEKRTLSGSKFREYRASMDLAADEATVLAAIWESVVMTPTPTVTQRTVLRRTDNQLLVHDLIDGSIARDREATTLVDKGPHEVRIELRNDLGPPPNPKHVLVPLVHGRWTLTPTDVRTHVTFQCVSDPGGSIPAFLVRGAQQAQIQRDVERMLQSLASRAPTTRP